MAREQNIEAAIVVVVTPLDGTVDDRLELRIHFLKIIVAVVAINTSDVVDAIEARDQQIEIAIRVVISPIHGTTIKLLQTGINLIDAAAGRNVIPIDEGKRLGILWCRIFF